VAREAVNRLPRKCGTLNISQTYRPPRPVKGITLRLFFYFYFIKCFKYEIIYIYPFSSPLNNAWRDCAYQSFTTI
jgi:hypothetical protein